MWLFFPSFWNIAFIMEHGFPWIFKKPLWEPDVEKRWLKSWPKKRECLWLGTKAPRSFSTFWVRKGTPCTSSMFKACGDNNNTEYGYSPGWLSFVVSAASVYGMWQLWELWKHVKGLACISSRIRNAHIARALQTYSVETHAPLPAPVEEVRFLT